MFISLPGSELWNVSMNGMFLVKGSLMAIGKIQRFFEMVTTLCPKSTDDKAIIKKGIEK